MAQQFKVLINAGKDQAPQTLQAEQGAGQRGRPLIIKAKAGAKYQLVEMGKGKGNNTDLAPDNIKAKRVGKHLHLMFETDTVADVIIEDYYDVMPEGYNGVIGKAENGSYYEYLTEDPTDPGLIPELKDNATAVTQALGGAEVSPAGAAVAFAAFPLLGALGLLGGAAAVAAAANTNTNTTSTGTTTGKLDATAPNDSGVLGDNKTNDNTPTLTGTVPTGSTATVTINGQTYPVTVNPNGTWSFTNPTNLPDGTYYPVLNVTTNGVTTPTNLTPFTIDTTPPTVAVVSNAAALAAGETANITFTLSEPSSDFALDDIAVTGGTLSNLTQSSTDPKVYTATFTPSSTGTSATISVASDKFADAAANRNTDGAEANNTVSFKTNATVTGALTPSAPNDSGALKDNLTNDNTPNLSGKVPPGSTATVTLNGKTYPATVNPDGTWSAQIPDTDKLPDGTYTPQLNVTTDGVTTTTPITPFTIDTVPATVAVTSNASTLASGQTTNLTFTLSEPVADFGADDVQVTGGTLSNFQKSPTDPKVYTATFTPNTSGTSATITVPSDKFADPAANRNTDGAEPNNTVTLATNAYASGQLAPVSDNTTGIPNDHKTNDATPELTGKVPAGATATVTVNGVTYPVTVAPDGTWTFTQPTNLPDGTYTPVLNVTQNGQTSSVPITPFTIDTVPPTVVVAGSNTSALTAGQSTTLTFTLSEGTTDLTDADLAVTGGTLGPLQQSATNPLVYTATFTATPGTTSNTTASVSIASDKFADAAGNLNKDGAETNNTWSSTVTPASSGTSTTSVKTALTIDPISGDNVITATDGSVANYTVTGKVTGTYAAGDVVSLVIGTKTYGAIVQADGTYSTVVPMSELKADSDTKIEGSVTGTGGQYATAAQDYTVETTNTPTQTALSINPVTADNIIAAAESTGTIPLTGTVTGKYAAGDVVTLTVKGINYSGTAAANGTYSIAVPATELIADSDTQVDGTVTGTGGTVAKAIQDYGVDTTTATSSVKTALTIDPITGDNVVTPTEGSAATYTVTGKVTGTYAAGDYVSLVLGTTTYGATVQADGTYSTVVPMSAIKADPDTKIEGSVTGTGGQYATASQDYVVEATSTPTQTALSINPVTADNIIGSTESTGNIAITGTVTGKFAAGDIVTLTVKGVNYSGTADAAGKYSIAVPATELIADSDTQVDGTVTGTGGTVAKAVQDYGVDANINPTSASLKTALTIDPITGDNIITLSEGGAATYTVTGKVTGTYAAGDYVSLVLGTTTYGAIVQADGTYSTVVPMSALKADPDTKIEGSVTGGNGGQYATAAQDYVVEATNTPTQTALSINPVTADNIIGSTESTGNIAITGTVTGKFAAGDIVTLTVKGVNYSGTADAAGKYSIAVPASELIADSDTQVDGTVTGTGGTVAKAVQDYGVDANINPATATGALTPVAPNDSGTLGDNLTNDNTPTLSGTAPGGSTASVTIGTQTYPVTVNPDGTWNFTQPTNLPDGTYTPQLNVTTNGVTTTTPITPFTIDTLAPTVIVSGSNTSRGRWQRQLVGDLA